MECQGPDDALAGRPQPQDPLPKQGPGGWSPPGSPPSGRLFPPTYVASPQRPFGFATTSKGRATGFPQEKVSDVRTPAKATLSSHGHSDVQLGHLARPIAIQHLAVLPERIVRFAGVGHEELPRPSAPLRRIRSLPAGPYEGDTKPISPCADLHGFTMIVCVSSPRLG